MSRPTRGLASAATLYILFFLLLAAPIALAFDPNFDFYPADAEPCLLDAAKASKCQGDSPKALNACLCGNGGGFVVRAAQCLGKKDKKDVGSVYDTMADACAHSGTPLKVDKDDFADAADDGSKSSSSGGGGGGGGATTFPPHDPSPSLGGGGGGFGRETKSHYSVSTFNSAHPRQSYAALSSVSPDPQQHNFLAAWEPPASTSYNSSPRNSAAYVGPYAAPQHQQQAQPVLAELPPQTQARPVSNIFELESSAVAEAPAPLELPQAASQPVWQQQQQHTREYRPYIPK
ncbi:hypothetical protein LEL_00321 [Akanthomyces lecanii RCEF 1005]|uniref:Extracellular membrane protein, CFEM domain protein n=1 Tax=Akanthomyces lecanii RCEF 1005 TaxID=1081108 RepID=A0A162KLD7_CORDF|nr:hypothetical protein LEL_00321 [Akanthomyces lecanii RCEF 1005]